jgi:hypothetical protein
MWGLQSQLGEVVQSASVRSQHSPLALLLHALLLLPSPPLHTTPSPLEAYTAVNVRRPIFQLVLFVHQHVVFVHHHRTTPLLLSRSWLLLAWVHDTRPVFLLRLTTKGIVSTAVAGT